MVQEGTNSDKVRHLIYQKTGGECQTIAIKQQQLVESASCTDINTQCLNPTSQQQQTEVANQGHEVHHLICFPTHHTNREFQTVASNEQWILSTPNRERNLSFSTVLVPYYSDIQGQGVVDRGHEV